jgi:hypothetical protein
VEEKMEEVKVGDWIYITHSTLNNSLRGQIMRVIRIDETDPEYKYAVQQGEWSSDYRWANGIILTPLLEALK